MSSLKKQILKEIKRLIKEEKGCPDGFTPGSANGVSKCIPTPVADTSPKKLRTDPEDAPAQDDTSGFDGQQSQATYAGSLAGPQTTKAELLQATYPPSKKKSATTAPTGPSRSSILTLQKLMNGYFRMKNLPTLKPSKNSPNGEDGSLGPDSRNAMARIAAADKTAPRTVQGLIKWLQGKLGETLEPMPTGKEVAKTSTPAATAEPAAAAQDEKKLTRKDIEAQWAVDDFGDRVGTQAAPFGSPDALRTALSIPGAKEKLTGKTVYYKDLAGNVQSKTVGTKQNPTFTEGEIISQKYIEKDGKTYMQVQVKSSDGKVYTGEAPFRGDPQFARDFAAKDARSKMPPRSLEESKNWIKRAKENTSSSLFERLVKDISKKKVL